MLKKLLLPLLITSTLLSACATTDPQPPQIKVVEVPVIQEWPEPPPNNRPRLPIQDLTSQEKSDPGTYDKALAATVEVLSKYAQRLETTIDAYRHKK